MESWSKDWQLMLRFRYEPGSTCNNSIIPYALQFANCDRIEKNDAVYIFDEVGSGKTIMAGLMALHYLYNNPGQRVLVITTATLASHKSGNTSGGLYGTQENQYEYKVNYPIFLKDWYEKLPLRELGMEERVEVISKDYCSFNNPHAGRYGMIIIDEAQEFLKSGLERHKNLLGDYYWDGGNHKYNSVRDKVIKYPLTEKVVFLTATPIKTQLKDLETYRDLARKMLSKSVLPETPDKRRDYKEKFFDQILGRAEFDFEFPATRWFKYTIAALSDSKKDCPERLEPQIWTWDDQKSKNATLCEEIRKAMKEDVCNRFLIFARWVTRRRNREDAYSIEEDLKNGLGLDDKAIKVITGENSDELRAYSGKGKNADLPLILILNYQVAEAGINLPGYNYVINYHIPSYPSALEQRFGRIDRLNNNKEENDYYSKIHVCYLIRTASISSETSLVDSHTCNFREAVLTYLHGLLPYLPSRNTLLSEEVLNKYKILDQEVENELDMLKKWKDDKAAFQAYQNHFYNLANEVPFRYKNLITFFDQQDSESVAEEGDATDRENLKNHYRKVIEKEIDRREEYIKKRIPLKEYDEILGLFSKPESQDVIFYKDDSGQFQYEQLQVCTEQIRHQAESYMQSFKQEIKKIKDFHEQLSSDIAAIHDERSIKDWKPVCQCIGFSSEKMGWEEAFGLIWEKAMDCQECIVACQDKFGYRDKLKDKFRANAENVGKKKYYDVYNKFYQESKKFPNAVRCRAAQAFYDALKDLQDSADKRKDETFNDILRDAAWRLSRYTDLAVCHKEPYLSESEISSEEFEYKRVLSETLERAETETDKEIKKLAWNVFKESARAVDSRILNMEFTSEQDLIKILRSEMKRALCYIGLDAAFSGQAGSPEKYEKMVDSFLSPIAGALLNVVNE